MSKENQDACGICGDSHFYRDCKYVVINVKVPDKPIPSRARLSLPDILELRKFADESYSVVTRTTLEAGTEFGPFIAKKNLTLNPSVTFPIKLFLNEESYLSEYYLDTLDEDECCWMMFIKPANDVEEQNLICYQEGNDIFFGSIRDIPAGEELKVWYSPHCAFKMQKNTLSFKKTGQTPSGKNITELDDLDSLVKEQQHIVPRVVWNCKFCYKLEKNVTDFAAHLLTHYGLHKRSVCEFCQCRFRYLSDYKKHLKIVHGEAMEKSEDKSQETALKKKDSLQKVLEPDSNKNSIGGPLLMQCLNDSMDNSNSLLPQSDVNLFDLENYDNQHLIFESENLRLSLDVIGSNTTIKDLDEFYLDSKTNKESEKIEKYVCDICLRHFRNLKGISNHLKLHIGKYICPTCKKIFARQESFKGHKCNQVFSLKCPKCPRIFYQKKYLAKHLSVYHDKKFTCITCKKKYFSASELKNHHCKMVPKENRCSFKCPQCPKVFISERGLRNHKHLKHPTTKDEFIDSNYVCSQCSQTYSSKDNYRRHVMCVHEKSRTFECRICDKTFSRKDILNMHLKNIHLLGSKEKYQCSECKKEFKSKNYLDSHIKSTHMNVKFPCLECLATFKYSRNLTRHVKVVHERKRNIDDMHECPICKIKMKLKNSLQRHIKKKHPNKYMTQCLELSVKKDEMKHLRYRCPVCKHEVKRKSSLQRHMLKKHPEQCRNISDQLKECKTFDEELDHYMNLQKNIENLNFNENLFNAGETIDRFLKESSDQISILFSENPKNETGNVTEKNRTEIGLSMPDLSELDQELNSKSHGKNTSTTLNNMYEPQMTIDASNDVVLYVLNDKLH
ncbi:hypothetical protein ABEB36_011928 [Hypothenemus hampei]|uniref:Uncharacterized protein n=1 Tax=Hypothenemus hampei TaxID=57062 RepID=A0ABD1EC57_HYPHA